MKLNDFFDRIYVINLQRRVDRLDKFKELSDSIGFDYDIFTAFDGREINENSSIEDRVIEFQSNNFYNSFDDYFRGQVGCAFSHLRLLKHCRSNNIKNILILEDDVGFSENFQNRFENFISDFNQEWDMIYFSGSIIKTNESFKTYSKLISCHTTHSYAVNYSAYDYLIQNIESKIFSKPIDVIYSELQSKLKSWITIPFLTYQLESFSDIQNMVTGYESIKKYL
jgi:hypothetical protein